jgi:hypothetical protein
VAVMKGDYGGIEMKGSEWRTVRQPNRGRELDYCKSKGNVIMGEQKES